MIRVILLIDCASEFDRKLLRGIMKYSKENGPWLFYRMPSDFRWGQDREEWILEWARKWKADAIIGRWDEVKVNLLKQLNIPIVLQNNMARSDVYSNLTGDYVGTGCLAAQYFRKKLFVDYAFFGVRNIIWSEERCKGFEQSVSSFGCRFFSYKVEPFGAYDRDGITQWLTALPKPTALFCCDDAHALFVTETCRMAGIRVPEDISVLGVDNDELLCGISDPPISSIELDVERGGYQTCSLLHSRLLTGNREPFNVVISPLGVVQRQSTCLYNISDPNVSRIVDFIDNNFSSEIGIKELLDIVPLSRRSLEIKFKKELGTTVYQYIIRNRVDHMAHLLATTEMMVPDIAYKVGFRDCSNIARVFKKFKGCSPLEYRQKYCVF